MMTWRKMGKIFTPSDHTLPAGCQAFAQSPQALVFEDFVRIYFSTRAIDPVNGKYLSHVAFVDFAKNLRDIIQVASEPVIRLGALGCFDEHGIFPFSVMRDGDRILSYTTGWNRRVSVSVDTAIGLAESHDGGLTFERLGDGPVLAASLNEPCLVGDGYVKKVGHTYYMWYIFGTGWKPNEVDGTPERTYKIGQAISPDGVEWTKDEARRIIPDLIGPDESQALPTVVSRGTRSHMFFCYRETFDFRQGKGRGYRIGHAWSDDLKVWTRDDTSALDKGIEGEWDSDMQCYPNVFEMDGEIYLLYNGNAFGRDGFGAARLEA